MPIIYIHGVAVREEVPNEQVVAFLRRYIAPKISDDPDNVDISYVFWGDIGAQFFWDRDSRPRSPLTGQGGQGNSSVNAITTAEMREVFSDISLPANDEAPSVGLASGGPGLESNLLSDARLKDLTPRELSDLLVTTLQTNVKDKEQHIHVSIAADLVAHDPQTFPLLSQCANFEEEWALLGKLIAEHLTDQDPLAGMGPGWLQKMGDRIKETLHRSVSLPGYAVSRVATEIRKPLNNFITLFLGDIFTYLDKRGDASNPGAITRDMLDALQKAKNNQKERNNEPLIVLSHSMGGQIVYDVVTHFLPNLPEHSDTCIDFWCASASQVGLFEELKLFIEKDIAYKKGNPVPFPNKKHLKYWWNVWDHNDFVSFTAKNIINGIDDEEYNSGMSVIGAHGAYLKQPSFFRVFASKIEEAQKNNLQLQ